MSDPIVQTSKFLSYVLRHEPGALGLNLEPGGWVDVETLLERARAGGNTLDREHLRAVIHHSEKQRFALSDDGSKIRANYGHSIDVDLDLTPTSPPRRLYHETSQDALRAIQEAGLQPQSRQYVHLSSTREQARHVGRRHGPPLVLTVGAEGLNNAGHSLYSTTDAVWLTNHVPPRLLEVLEGVSHQ